MVRRVHHVGRLNRIQFEPTEGNTLEEVETRYDRTRVHRAFGQHHNHAVHESGREVEVIEAHIDRFTILPQRIKVSEVPGCKRQRRILNFEMVDVPRAPRIRSLAYRNVKKAKSRTRGWEAIPATYCDNDVAIVDLVINCTRIEDRDSRGKRSRAEERVH